MQIYGLQGIGDKLENLNKDINIGRAENHITIGDSLSDLENTSYIAERKVQLYLKDCGEKLLLERKRQKELKEREMAPRRRILLCILVVLLIFLVLGLSRQIYLNICFSGFERAIGGIGDHTFKNGYYYYVIRPDFPLYSGGRLEIFKFTHQGTEDDVRLYISVLEPGKYDYALSLDSYRFDGGEYHLLKVSDERSLLPEYITDENLELMRMCKDEIDHIFELSYEMWGIPMER